MTDSTPSERLHALDALRAIAMLLGIVLHAEMAYMANVWPIWPVDDEGGNVLFDISHAFIHTFRMEAFFLMAGFFACMLHARYGPRRFMTHRAKRILLPLVIGALTIVPACKFAWMYGANLAAPVDDRVSTGVLLRLLVADPWSPGLILYHLWFLWHLLVMYAVAVAWVAIARRVGPLRRLNTMMVAATGWIVRHHVLALALAIAAFPFLFLQTMGLGVDTDGRVFPTAFRVIAYYLVFFSGGWLLFRQRELLPRLARWWLPQLMIGACFLFPVYLVLGAMAFQGPLHPLLDAIGRAICVLTTTCIVVGITGMFLRFFDRPSPTMRYVSDSAYWLYLAHLPLVLALNYLFLPLEAGPVAKFLIVSGLATAILLLTYQLCVRHTPIGWMLNGRRRRRAVPIPAAPPAAATTG